MIMCWCDDNSSYLSTRAVAMSRIEPRPLPPALRAPLLLLLHYSSGSGSAVLQLLLPLLLLLLLLPSPFLLLPWYVFPVCFVFLFSSSAQLIYLYWWVFTPWREKRLELFAFKWKFKRNWLKLRKHSPKIRNHKIEKEKKSYCVIWAKDFISPGKCDRSGTMVLYLLPSSPSLNFVCFFWFNLSFSFCCCCCSIFFHFLWKLILWAAQ